MTPDLSTLSLVELRQLRRAVAIAIGAVEAGGVACLYADADGMSVVITIPTGEEPDDA